MNCKPLQCEDVKSNKNEMVWGLYRISDEMEMSWEWPWILKLPRACLLLVSDWSRNGNSTEHLHQMQDDLESTSQVNASEIVGIVRSTYVSGFIRCRIIHRTTNGIQSATSNPAWITDCSICPFFTAVRSNAPENYAYIWNRSYQVMRTQSNRFLPFSL